MLRIQFLFSLILGVYALELPASDVRPDVLMVIIDDMNDATSLYDSQSPIKTPNLIRLASKGMFFRNAYCQSPACNPSRAATLTGLNPSNTGIYGNKSDWKKATKGHPTVFKFFKSHGYEVRGAGKVFHHHWNGAFHDPDSFHGFRPMDPQNMPPQKLNKAPEYGSRNTDWGIWPKQENQTIDYKSVDYCIEQLRNFPESKPIFLTCGLFKPHSPFFAPKKYHDLLTRTVDIETRDDDIEDLPPGATKLLNSKKWFYNGMMKLEDKIPGSFSNFRNAYGACSMFADAQLGRLLDIIDKYPRGRDLVIVLWSDHGFHIGEKNHIEKFALWEKATRVPLVVVAPGITNPGSTCYTPVDLSHLYPTLLDLAGISDKSISLDGKSLRPLLIEDQSIEWKQPALTTYGKGNHAIRLGPWRYIRYADGTEELYDRRIDPNEWNNLAQNKDHSEIIIKLKNYLPKQESSPVVDPKRGR